MGEKGFFYDFAAYIKQNNGARAKKYGFADVNLHICKIFSIFVAIFDI